MSNSWPVDHHHVLETSSYLVSTMLHGPVFLPCYLSTSFSDSTDGFWAPFSICPRDDINEFFGLKLICLPNFSTNLTPSPKTKRILSNCYLCIIMCMATSNFSWLKQNSPLYSLKCSSPVFSISEAPLFTKSPNFKISRLSSIPPASLLNTSSSLSSPHPPRCHYITSLHLHPSPRHQHRFTGPLDTCSLVSLSPLTSLLFLLHKRLRVVIFKYN